LADSTLTKKALASALKELMQEVPFEKINVGQICEKCDMNRKSFYYHFKDKYDLVNWIFDIEFISIVNKQKSDDHWESWEALSTYFYENHTFYRKALKITGQNSFSDHFREFIYPVIRKRLEEITSITDIPDFGIHLLVDVIICAFERWLSEKNCMPPQQFVSIIKSLTQSVSTSLYEEMNMEQAK